MSGRIDRYEREILAVTTEIEHMIQELHEMKHEPVLDLRVYKAVTAELERAKSMLADLVADRYGL